MNKKRPAVSPPPGVSNGSEVFQSHRLIVVVLRLIYCVSRHIINATCSSCGGTRKVITSKPRNPGQCRSCARKIVHGYISRYFTGFKIGRWKAGAKERDMPWILTCADLDRLWEWQDGKCALSGLPLTTAECSLDRIDSDGVYEPANIQFTTSAVNMAKGTMSVREFVEMCRTVQSHHDQG